MKNTMKRTLGLFAAALLTMSLALSVYASGHDLTFTDKGNRMHVKDKTVHVQTYYPYKYYVLDVLEDAMALDNLENVSPEGNIMDLAPLDPYASLYFSICG